VSAERWPEGLWKTDYKKKRWAGKVLKIYFGVRCRRKREKQKEATIHADTESQHFQKGTPYGPSRGRGFRQPPFVRGC